MAKNIFGVLQLDHQNMPVIEIENAELIIAVIPELGGKIVKIM